MSDATKLAIEALEAAIPACEIQGDKPGQLRWHTISDQLTAALAALRAQPADPFKKLSDAQVLWLAESHGIDVYASNPLAFYADLISTTPAQPDHSELVKDAARYRWLREQHWSDSKFAVVSNPKTAVNLGSICPSRELLDEAIDAAIGETME